MDVVKMCYCHLACKGGDEPGHEYNEGHHHTFAHIHVKEILEVLRKMGPTAIADTWMDARTPRS